MDALMSLSISQTEQQLKQIFKRYANPDKGSRLPQQMILQLLQINQKFQQNLKHNVPYSPDKLILDQFQQQLNINNVNTYQFILDYYKSAITDALQQDISGYSAHVQKAILYIRENFANNISLVTVANQIHVSNAHLSRLFKKELNTSFIDYLTSYRIELAKKMIKETNKELKEISELTGFNSYNYFLRVYKEKTGLTPTQEFNRR
jgi:YesN/AraC family two-component response regulator